MDTYYYDMLHELEKDSRLPDADVVLIADRLQTIMDMARDEFGFKPLKK